MNPSQLINRYLFGNPLTKDERRQLAKQLKSATKASQAISMAKKEAAAACHDWQPAEPTAGWVAYAYIKFMQVWRVYHNGEIVAAYDTEGEARQAAARMADDKNAEWRGKILDPRRETAVKHRETPTLSRGTIDGAQRIDLGNGKYAIVDAEDYVLLAGDLWGCSAQGYAIKSSSRSDADVSAFMHRIIMNPPDGMQVDHINGDKLDNRRCNLRVVASQQNAMNQKQHADSTSPYKGVYWRKDAKRWHAHIQVEGRKMFLGYFDTAEEGARAYNEAAKKYHGEFARLNEV